MLNKVLQSIIIMYPGTNLNFLGVISEPKFLVLPIQMMPKKVL